VPLGPSSIATSVTRIEGYVPQANENMNISYNVVGGDYFRATGIKVLEGRGSMTLTWTTTRPLSR